MRSLILIALVPAVALAAPKGHKKPKTTTTKPGTPRANERETPTAIPLGGAQHGAGR